MNHYLLPKNEGLVDELETLHAQLVTDSQISNVSRWQAEHVQDLLDAYRHGLHPPYLQVAYPDLKSYATVEALDQAALQHGEYFVARTQSGHPLWCLCLQEDTSGVRRYVPINYTAILTGPYRWQFREEMARGWTWVSHDRPHVSPQNLIRVMTDL